MPLLEHLARLLAADEFQAASREAMRYAKSNPDDLDFARTAGELFLDYFDPHGALRLLRKAEMRFPHDPHIMELLGWAHFFNDDHDRAHLWLSRAFEAFPASDTVARSECAAAIGDVLWEQNERERALAAWRDAARLDPTNADIADLIAAHTNAYGEPKAPTPMFDDFYHFRTIQFERFLSPAGENGEGEFDEEDIEEVQRGMAAIIAAYNERIVPLGNTLDAMTAEEKTKLFESIEIDWDAPQHADAPAPALATDISFDDDDDDDDDAALEELARKVIEAINTREYGFLPTRGMGLAMLGDWGLLEAGLDRDRIIEIILTGKATDDEQLIFKWAMMFAMESARSFTAERRQERLSHRAEAERIAAILLGPDDAREAVTQVMASLLERKNAERGTGNGEG